MRVKSVLRLLFLVGVFANCSHLPVVTAQAEPEATTEPVAEAPSTAAPDLVHIKFNTSVDLDSVAKTIFIINLANEAKARGIIIEINSPGGIVDYGFELSKAIEESKVPIVCVVDGYAQSMAGYILQSCPVRLMTKRSFLMIHQPGIYQTGGQQSELANLAEYLQVCNAAMVEHMAARSKLTTAEISKRIENGRRWYLNYGEATEAGFIDGVLGTVKEADVWVK